MNLLSVWTVYDRPSDYPDSFVARRHVVRAGGITVATLDAVFSTSLDGVRAKLPPGLYRMPRHADDEPHIVESWI